MTLPPLTAAETAPKECRHARRTVSRVFGWDQCLDCKHLVTKWPEGWITLDEAYKRVPG